MTAIDRDYSRRGGLFYGCSHYRKRGSAICQNSLLIEQESLDTGVLEAISQAMDEKIISEAIDKFLMRMNPSDDDRLSRRRVLEKELSVTETHIQNLLNAISNGEKQPRALIARLNSEEARKDELTAQMNELSKVYPVQQLGTARLKRDGAKEFQT